MAKLKSRSVCIEQRVQRPLCASRLFVSKEREGSLDIVYEGRDRTRNGSCKVVVCLRYLSYPQEGKRTISPHVTRVIASIASCTEI